MALPDKDPRGRRASENSTLISFGTIPLLLLRLDAIIFEWSLQYSSHAMY